MCLYMKFERVRNLKNNIFSTKIKRVEEDNQDCILKEEQLEDDFGCVLVEVGGIFEAEFKTEEDGLLISPILSSTKEIEHQKDVLNFSFQANICNKSDACFCINSR